MGQQNSRHSALSSDAPKDVKWRVDQSFISGEIEGIRRDPALSEYVTWMEKNDIPSDERIKRMIDWATQFKSAAE